MAEQVRPAAVEGVRAEAVLQRSMEVPQALKTFGIQRTDQVRVRGGLGAIPQMAFREDCMAVEEVAAHIT